MVSIHEAAIRSAGLMEKGLSVAGWATLMSDFNAILQGRDAAIRRAAALRPVLTDGERNPQAPFGIDGSSAVGAGEHRLLRLAALQATRAATLTATETDRLVLSGVEQEIIEVSRHRGPLELALRGWGLAVSQESSGMSPVKPPRVV